MFSLVACGKGGTDGKLDELAKIRDSSCACKDKACADAEHEKYTTWKKGMSKDDKPSEDQMKKYEALRTELRACRDKFDMVAPPTPSAPEPAPTAPAPAPTTP
jgi:hypothetical protein